MADNSEMTGGRAEQDAVVAASGELDLYVSEELWNRIAQVLQENSVTVDIREATFIDTAILSCLARAATTMLKRHKRLKVIVKSKSQPERVLDISGFGSLMDIESVPAESQVGDDDGQG